MDITKLIEDIRKSVIGNLNKMSERVELSAMGQHKGETVRVYTAKLE